MPGARARSISRPTYEKLLRLQEHHASARVLAVFEHACNLVIADDDGRMINQVGRTSGHATADCAASHLSVIALVTPKVGDGPLNIVLDDVPHPFAGISTGEAATLEKGQVDVDRASIEIGELRVNLAGATVWEPRPDWDVLRTRRAATASRLPILRDACLRHGPAGTTAVKGGPADTTAVQGGPAGTTAVQGGPAGTTAVQGGPAGTTAVQGGPADSLLALLKSPRLEGAVQGAVLSRAAKAAEDLRAGWVGDRERLRAGAAGLAGLGGGLTPAGDDFLVGAMLGAWLTHPTPTPLCRTIVESAAPRTTTLSAAFLQAAARGECTAAWHTLLAALSCRPDRFSETCQVSAAARDIVAHGATSGADALAGFLFF